MGRGEWGVGSGEWGVGRASLIVPLISDHVTLLEPLSQTTQQTHPGEKLWKELTLAHKF